MTSAVMPSSDHLALLLLPLSVLLLPISLILSSLALGIENGRWSYRVIHKNKSKRKPKLTRERFKEIGKAKFTVFLILACEEKPRKRRVKNLTE